jgi:pyruvate/2-oxoglutarate dehydrogenase complex dihydrolipoamide dehydrogenase (E3) component
VGDDRGGTVPSDRNDAAVDVIVLGAGSTGTNVAWYARDHGLSVAIVEAELVGGECSYWACIPSKALLVPTELVAAARRLPPAAAAVTGHVEAEAVLAHRTEQTGGWDDDGQAAWLDDLGVTLLRGRGRLVAERTVEVTGDGSEPQRLRARRAVVMATGSRATIPPIDGLREAGVWDNRDVTAAERVPDHLLVLGGGAVGCEMAQAYRRLGAEVTLIEMAERLLGPYEPEAAALLQETLEAEGVTVLTGTSAAAVRRDQRDGPVTVTTEDGRELTGDELLVAIGRTPNTDDLGLEHVGLEPGGPLEVDDRLRVAGSTATGCTPPATSPVARCSPTRASTRRASWVTSSADGTSRHGPTTAPSRRSCSPTRTSRPSAAPKPRLARTASTSPPPSPIRPARRAVHSTGSSVASGSS